LGAGSIGLVDGVVPFNAAALDRAVVSPSHGDIVTSNGDHRAGVLP
jgi:hypothetical protein